MKRFTYTLFLASLGLFVLAGAEVLRSSSADDRDDPFKQLEVFSRVLERVRRDYVDGQDVTYKDLIDNALRGMLSSLDPHSEFLDVSRYEDLREDTEGTYGGVGLQVQAKEGALQVIAPMEDSPAFEAGILPGDRIVKIDGKPTERMTQTDAVGLLRGQPGEAVVLTLQRSSSPDPLDVTLVRADIRVYTVKDFDNKRTFLLADDKIGYIRITQFAERTAIELEEAMRILESKGMQALILDLRSNPGGLLDQAVAVSERFLERGQPIVSTVGRNPANNTQRLASGRGRVRDIPLVILVNGGSASASEIVAGSFQDLKRAVIVGEQTFGKGSVQSILPLSDGSALRLTTAKYYTPSHRVIHEQGIKPDVIVPLTEDEEVAIQLRRIPGGKTNLEEALRTFPEERRVVLRELVEKDRDPQLERARDLLKGLRMFSRRMETRSDRGTTGSKPESTGESTPQDLQTPLEDGKPTQAPRDVPENPVKEEPEAEDLEDVGGAGSELLLNETATDVDEVEDDAEVEPVIVPELELVP